MEDTPIDQQTKSESKKSTETQDGGPYSCSTRQISSGSNSCGKTLIQYDLEKTLYIKEEIVQDEERHQSGKHDLLSGRNQLDQKCISAEISSENRTGVKTLIEYDNDETLQIKEEIVQDQERHQQGNHDFFAERNQLHEKFITTEMPSDNNFGSKTLIKHEYDDTLEIKEEIIEDTNEADIMTVEEPRTSIQKNLQESKSEPKKKFNCDNCARSYVHFQSLYKHRKFDCGVIPQFSCEFCSKRFKRKNHVKRHMDLVHQKTKSKTSQGRHNCDTCSQSYSSLSALYKHKTAEHAAVKIHFICDICDYKFKRKYYLSKHITLQHTKL